MSFYIFCIPFFVVSILHLIFCLSKKTQLTNFTKVLLMPCLAIAILLSTLTGIRPNIPKIPNPLNINPFSTSIYLIIALLAGTLGDYFLIRPVSKRRFQWGILFFFIGHIFYLIILIPRSQFWILPSWIVILYICVCLGIILSIYYILKIPKKLRGFAALVYAGMLFLVNFMCFSAVLQILLQTHDFLQVPTQYYIALIGNLFFILSDSILSFTLFRKDFPHSRFIIMSTYIIAQFLLVLGCTVL